jgi:hypothetical protein
MDIDQAYNQATEADDEIAGAEVRLMTAEATIEVTTAGGLRYAPISLDHGCYIVGCDGQLLGHLRPGVPGRVLHGWMATTFDGATTLGPFLTARAAAAALAAHKGMPVGH